MKKYLYWTFPVLGAVALFATSANIFAATTATNTTSRISHSPSYQVSARDNGDDNNNADNNPSADDSQDSLGAPAPLTMHDPSSDQSANSTGPAENSPGDDMDAGPSAPTVESD